MSTGVFTIYNISTLDAEMSMEKHKALFQLLSFRLLIHSVVHFSLYIFPLFTFSLSFSCRVELFQTHPRQ